MVLSECTRVRVVMQCQNYPGCVLSLATSCCGIFQVVRQSFYFHFTLSLSVCSPSLCRSLQFCHSKCLSSPSSFLLSNLNCERTHILLHIYSYILIHLRPPSDRISLNIVLEIVPSSQQKHSVSLIDRKSTRLNSSHL